MNIILNNPYRIAGILVGTTAREQERQIKRLKQFIGADIEPEEDYSFPALGALQRTIDDVEQAASMLNLDSDKMMASLFWFYNGNNITDEPAFDALKEGNINVAFNIWNRLIKDTDENGNQAYKPITTRNFSAFHNSAILNLTSTDGNFIDGITEALIFLDSDLVNKFIAIATDATYKVTKKELQLSFLNQLASQIQPSDKIKNTRFIQTISKLQFAAKQNFLKNYAQKPIDEIEKSIEECEAKRNLSKANAANAGQQLYQQTAKKLNQLKSVLGISNIQFKNISDKVAEEILECGYAYFKHYKDSDTDPSSLSMDLFKNAKSIALGNVVSQRIQENIKGLQEWIDGKNERDQHNAIAQDIAFINEKLERFQKCDIAEFLIFGGKTYIKADEIISKIEEFIDDCIPRLLNIENSLGYNDELYLNISNAVAINAFSKLVETINREQKGININYSSKKELRSFLLIIYRAIRASRDIGNLYMDPKQVLNYKKNHATLESMADDLEKKTSFERFIKDTLTNENGYGTWFYIALIGILLWTCSGS